MRTVVARKVDVSFSRIEWLDDCALMLSHRHGRTEESELGFNLATHVGDDLDRVLAHRLQLNAYLPSPPLWLEQVHGIEVFDADTLSGSQIQSIALHQSPPPVADAAVTSKKALPLAVLTADCLPVVLVDTEQAILGVAHAGWRGLAYGVVEQTLSVMKQKGAGAISAYLGPCIGRDAFEVGAEVKHVFVERIAGSAPFFKEKQGVEDKFYADLQNIATLLLKQQGVQDIAASPICTVNAQSDFFSYRANPKTGRFATLAWLPA